MFGHTYLHCVNITVNTVRKHFNVPRLMINLSRSHHQDYLRKGRQICDTLEKGDTKVGYIKCLPQAAQLHRKNRNAVYNNLKSKCINVISPTVSHH